MITTSPSMTHLFEQLGLDASEQGIAEFIKGHQLGTEVALCDAAYWSESQRQFLVEQIKADAPWALIVDQFSESLHSDAVRRSSGLN